MKTAGNNSAYLYKEYVVFTNKRLEMASETSHKNPSKITEDLTGRNRMVKNIIFSWGSYIVVVVAGFIMPRLIDQHVGQSLLGIWDFCWSLVSYLGMAGLGLGSSVNRFVAKYRAKDDVENLRQAVSSVVSIQLVIATFVLLVTIALVLLLPFYFSESFGDDILIAQFVVGLLGSSVAVQFAFDVGRGVITGCHRWDVHGFINAGSKAFSLAMMIIVLISGGGLVGLASVHLGTVVLTEIVRMTLAHHICRELIIHPKFIRKKHVRKMLSFGGKTIISMVSGLMLFQTTNILVASTLGPAALAIFSRPLALVIHIQTFTNKFAYILTPTVGSLQGLGKEDELKRLLLMATRFGAAFTLPLLTVLVVFGDVILELWMGPSYANWLLISILAVGHFLSVSQSSVMRVLVGMNKHGWIGVINLCWTFLLMIVGLFMVYSTGWSLEKAALVIVVPLSLGNGFLVPIYGCKCLGVSYFQYLREVFLLPVVCMSIFASFLVASRVFLGDTFLSFLVGVLGGGGVLMGLYWKYLLNDSHRELIARRLKLSAK